MSPQSRPSSVAARPLVGHTSRLLLTGFLAGMIARRMVSPSAELWFYAVGLVLVLVWSEWEAFSRRRRERAARRTSQTSVSSLERRLHRHVSRLGVLHVHRSSTGRPQRGLHRQYVAVPHSKNAR
ncbi:MAG: hypothetical protein ACREJB_11540 [Planctomycetaceae bacterium]